jgi:hypothetical protein
MSDRSQDSSRATLAKGSSEELEGDPSWIGPWHGTQQRSNKRALMWHPTAKVEVEEGLHAALNDGGGEGLNGHSAGGKGLDFKAR